MFYLLSSFATYSGLFSSTPHWRTDINLGGFSFLLLFFNLNLFILIRGQLLYNIVLILPDINMNPPRVYTCSQSWTLLPSPSPYHPFGSSQYTSPKLPVSCIEPGLAIHFLYYIIHVSKLSFRIISSVYFFSFP